MNATSPRVAALYVRHDSIYQAIDDVDPWDVQRNARHWPGGCPVVAHPPCAQWGRLRGMARRDDAEKELAILAILAVLAVERWGGVLEHPKGSTLWKQCKLPPVGTVDHWGGFTIEVDQHRFGHLAEKLTWLYICGLNPQDLPPMPDSPGKPKYIIGWSGRRKDGTRCRERPEMPTPFNKASRELTPPAFGHWLVEIARRCKTPPQAS